MPEAIPRERLVRSLGRLSRGLSSLFWGLPVALIVCFHTARADSLFSLGMLPAVLSTAWLVHALYLISGFHRQELVWQVATDRARILSTILCGLSPFLYWSKQLPHNFFFSFMVMLMGFSALYFLASLNVMLRRLGAMLPDETLRSEVRLFTSMNYGLLAAMALVLASSTVLVYFPLAGLPLGIESLRVFLLRFGRLMGIPLFLLPLSMTMAMLWKTKEVILDSLFSGKQ